MQRLLAVGVGGTAALGVGYLMGGLQAQAEAEGTAGTDEDPTKFLGIDLDIWAGFGMTVLGVGMSGKAGATRRYGQYVESAGTGVLNGVAYSYGLDLGRDSASAVA